MTFWRWVQLLSEFAKLKYQAAVGTEVLERLVTEEIATKNAIQKSELAVLGGKKQWRTLQMGDTTYGGASGIGLWSEKASGYLQA